MPSLGILGRSLLRSPKILQASSSSSEVLGSTSISSTLGSKTRNPPGGMLYISWIYGAPWELTFRSGSGKEGGDRVEDGEPDSGEPSSHYFSCPWRWMVSNEKEDWRCTMRRHGCHYLYARPGTTLCHPDVSSRTGLCRR
jgi:hypothetical protein